MLNDMKVGVPEFVGTFVLVFVPLSVASLGYSAPHVAGSFGFVLMVLAAGLGSFSGGHFNPSVTFAAALAKQIKWSALPIYWVAQISGGILAVWVMSILWRMNDAKLGAAIPNPDLILKDAWPVVFIAEAFGAFVLNLIILGSTDPKASKAVAPFSIGGALGLMVLVFASVTGGSFNPARYLGPAFFAGEWTMWGAYLTAPMVGAVLAVGVYQILKKTTPPTP